MTAVHVTGMMREIFGEDLCKWMRGDRKKGRPAKKPDGGRSRDEECFHSDAERSITNAIEAVKAAGSSQALTDAVGLLEKARGRVADHVEA